MSDKAQAKTETDLPLTEDGAVDTARLGERYDEPGLRTGSRVGYAAPRPPGDAAYLCSLARGISYRVVYAGRALIITKSAKTAISEAEYARLCDVADVVDFHDGERRVLRHIRKFKFYDLDGVPLDLPEIEDTYAGQAGVDAAEAAELERRFEGDDRPRAG